MHSVIVQPTFCPFLIRYIFVLSVKHLLHVRLLTVLCPLLGRYVCAPYDFRDEELNIFLHFSVRAASVTFIRICDSTNRIKIFPRQSRLLSFAFSILMFLAGSLYCKQNGPRSELT